MPMNDPLQIRLDVENISVMYGNGHAALEGASFSLSGGTTTASIEVGYTIADITAKAVFGLVIYAIAVRKSEAEGYKA